MRFKGPVSGILGRFGAFVGNRIGHCFFLIPGPCADRFYGQQNLLTAEYAEVSQRSLRNSRARASA